MALETLKDVKQIGGFNIVVIDDLIYLKPELFNKYGSMHSETFERDIRPCNFIYVCHYKNSLSFTLQKGPLNEVGINGCQVDTIIEAAKIMLEGFNNQLPCRENSIAITKLEEALLWLKKRKEDRIERGVEGTYKS